MNGREIELPNPQFLPDPSTSENNNQNIILGDEIMKNTKTCTHTHTCNPPGPNVPHSHTCYHTHTQVFSSEDDTKSHCYNISSSKHKTPIGNRQAVRKYREKKKAHTAFLEEEVKKLRLLNEHLVRKLQGQAALEAELSSLRALLFEIRGKVDVKLGCFPFEKHCSDNSGLSFEEGNGFGLQCPVENPGFGQNVCIGDGVDKPVFSWQEYCQPVIVDCHGTGNEMVRSLDQPPDALESLGSARNKGQ